MRFLVIEDDPVCRMFLAHTLEESTAGSVLVHETGEAGLAAFAESLEAGDPFHAVFIDIGLPGLDGLAVLERMRGLEAAAGVDETRRTRAVMVTALEGTRHVTRALFRGHAFEYLTKPVAEEAVKRVLEGMPSS